MFNRSYQIGTVQSNTIFSSIIYSGSIGGHVGSGGTVTKTVAPPTQDNTQVVVMRVLPVTVSYDETSIVAIFPSSPGAVVVNPPGSGGGGGGTGGGGSDPGGGGGKVPGGGSGPLPVD